MDLRSTLAAQDYAAIRNTASLPDPSPGNAVSKFSGEFARTLANGEQTALLAMAGESGPHALVQALAETEFAVEAAVTIRDKVVEAYQEILRMPV